MLVQSAGLMVRFGARMERMQSWALYSARDDAMQMMEDSCGGLLHEVAALLEVIEAAKHTSIIAQLSKFNASSTEDDVTKLLF